MIAAPSSAWLSDLRKPQAGICTTSQSASQMSADSRHPPVPIAHLILQRGEPNAARTCVTVAISFQIKHRLVWLILGDLSRQT
jgi:hypothetical protein